MSTDQIAARVAAMFADPPRPARVGDAVVLGLDGRSGAGKTSIAARIKELDPQVEVLHIENFYAGWSGLEAGPPRLVHQVLRPWAAGLSARARYWDWHANRWQDCPKTLPAPKTGKILIEGCASGALELDPFLSGLIWIEAPEQVRYRRAIRRDGATYAPYWELWAQQEEQFIAEHAPKSRADLIFAG